MRTLKFILGVILASLCLITTGCAEVSPRDNLSPRIEQKIDNANGKIDRIESNQNAIKFAIEKRTENTNTGVQFFQGEGGLIVGFGVVVIICVTIYFYRSSQKNEQIAKMLTEQIRAFNDPELEDSILRAALYTDVEKDVYHMMTKKERA